MTKQISIRIPDAIYQQLKEHPQTNTSIIIKAVEQYFRKEEPNNNLDNYVIQIQEQEINYLKQQIEDWKKISIMNMTLLQTIKYKLMNKAQSNLNSSLTE